MKYCAECGTQMSDDTVACPKCNPEINNPCSQPPSQSISTKKHDSKISKLILINIAISALTLIAVIIMYFVPLFTNNSTTSITGSKNYNSVCSKAQNGNHDWSTPTCVEPAQCYNCDVYKDDKLGHHDFWTSSDGFDKCMHCGMLYEVYMDSLD